MIKFFRHIRKQLLTKNNFSKYLIYAVGEIILVVIGILIALQINNWNEDKKLVKTEMQYYKNIKRQLSEDIKYIKSNIDFNQFYYNQYEFAAQQLLDNDRSNLDSLGIITLNLLEFSDFHQESNIYAALVNSGEIKLLTNQNIIEGLQNLEESYIYINRIELSHFDIIKIIYPDLQKVIRIKPLTVEKVDKLFEFEFQNHFNIIMEIMKEKNDIYNKTLNEIEDILQLIDQELTPQ